MKRLFCLAIWITLSLCSSSQLLYRCTSPAQDTTTYIFGSMHILPSDSYYYDPVIDTLLKQSQVFFTEAIDTERNPDFIEIGRMMTERKYYPAEKSLKDSVTPSQLNELQKFYQAHFNIPPYRFYEMLYRSPYVMHATLSRRVEGYIAHDRFVLDKAIKRKKKIILLDQPFEFRESMKWLIRSWTVDSLLHLPARFASMQKRDSLLFDAYQKQDTLITKQIIEKVHREERGREYHMITIRNKAWENIILEKSRKTNFIMCAMAHVLTANGLLNFFRKRNYSITSMPVSVEKK